MINIVKRTFALLELEQILRRLDQVFLGQDAAVGLHAELLVDLVTANATEVIAFFVEKQAQDERAGIRGSRGIARAQAAVNILQRFLFVLGRILLQTLDHVAVVHRGVHDLDLADAEFGDLLDHGLRQRLERASNHETFFFINRVLNQNAVLQIFNLLRFLHRQFLYGVEQLQDFFVGATRQTAIVLALRGFFLVAMVEERQRAEERRR